MKMKVFGHDMLLGMNERSIRAGRSQYLRPERVPVEPRERYWVNSHSIRERSGQEEVRICVVLNLFTGQTTWLDISIEEFATIPEVDLGFPEWETAMCAGTPPPVP